jgi:hypothetical protein
MFLHGPERGRPAADTTAGGGGLMIVRPFRGRLLCVRQTDHMALSGDLAAAWGNDHFPRPEPFGPLIQAAAEHDAGWAEWEAAPRMDSATRRPYQFTDMPVEEHLAFYQRGVDAVAAKDAHAGLLVNLHCQGLYNQRFGSAPDMTMRRLPPEQESAVRRAIAALQAQERELGKRVRLELPTLWVQYDLLQIYDLVSLVLCVPSLNERVVGPFTLRPAGDDEVTVQPWPFLESAVTCGVSGRLIADRDYVGDNDLRRELAAAEGMELRCVLKPVSA